MKTCSFAEAIRSTGLTHKRIIDAAERAGIDIVDGVPVALVEDIRKEQDMYIGLRKFASQSREGRYSGTTFDKRRLLEEIEKNEYFGLAVVDQDDLISGSQHEEVYLLRSDLPLLEEHLSAFFGGYALSGREMMERYLVAASGIHSVTVQSIRQYTNKVMFDRNITPAYTEFVKLALELPDLPKVKDPHVRAILKKTKSASAKEHLIRWLNDSRPTLPNPGYSYLQSVRPESQPIPAYDDATYIALAHMIFNPKYISQHRMIERALEYHIYIEMWLFLSLLYCCGVRAGDVCRAWRYLNLREKPENGFGLNVETLYEDILYDRIPDEVYERVCKYALGSIAASGQMPSKTAGKNTGTLAISITPELSTFFGMLTLISEAVMLRTGDGYMKESRTDTYLKKSVYRKFFGEEMYELLGGENLHSRRLNKDFLQGVEETARQQGCGPLMATAVASYARSHKDLSSIIFYLKDRALNAETAEMVVYLMMERGVFAFEQYQMLLTAYPDVMPRLPMRTQNELIATLEQSPYQIELQHAGEWGKLQVKEAFCAGNNDTVLEMLKGMYELSQGRGKGKDSGVHCILRSCGHMCVHPEYDSCLANACPHLVFTRYGYKALLEVLAQYVYEANVNKNEKARRVLRDIIQPRFVGIINTLMKDVHMSPDERRGVKQLMGEIDGHGG